MMMRDIPASVVYFAIFEFTHDSLMRRRKQGHECGGGVREVVSSLVAGGAAGVISWTLVFPLDIVKSRMQADYQCELYPNGWRQCVADIVRESRGGSENESITRTRPWKAFYVGLTPCLLRAFPVNAVTFAVNFQILKLLKVVE